MTLVAVEGQKQQEPRRLLRKQGGGKTVNILVRTRVSSDG